MNTTTIKIFFILFALMLLSLYSYKPAKLSSSSNTIQNYGCQAYTGPEVILKTNKSEIGDVKWILTNLYVITAGLNDKKDTLIDSLDNNKVMDIDPNPQVFNGKTYKVLYPSKHSKLNRSRVNASDLGLVFLAELDSNGNLLTINVDDPASLGKAHKLKKGTYFKTEVFQSTKINTPIPQILLETCKEISTVNSTPSQSPAVTLKFPPQNIAEAPGNKQLQLEYFLLDQEITAGAGYWSIHCKPAIYLYPKNKTLVNVQVFPKGELTYTDPKYPTKTGWMAWAYPNGTVEVNNKIYPYLYYEAKIKDELIQVPEEGFVSKKEDLSELLNQILPKLGLSQKEASEFKDYWVKSLPSSPYYFVGVLPQEHIDFLEPLEIIPKPESNIRVHLYFKLLDKPIEVKAPIIQTPKRVGFTMVEWGGMIKVNKDSDFTCLQ